MNRLRLALLLLSCAIGFAAFAEVVDASVCEVLANPASFDGKTIRITNATVIAGFDEFVVEGTGCNPAGAIWLAYPEGTKGKAGPAAFLRLQLAKNNAANAEAPKRAPVTLQKNDQFKRFDSQLATPYKSRALCLGCPRNTVTATLIGRIDGVSAPGMTRDASGKVTAIAGFGNMNRYPARLVLQEVSGVSAREIDYAATPVKGDSRRASAASREQAQRAAAAFGEPGEDNGVMVGFGVVNELLPDEGAKGNADSPDGVLYHVTIDMNRLGKEAVSNAIAHIGTHIADIRGGVLLRTLDEAESRAWQTTFMP